MRIRLLTFLIALLMLLSMVACNDANADTGGAGDDSTESTTQDEQTETPGEVPTDSVWGDGYLETDHPTYEYDEFSILSRPENQYIDALFISKIELTSTSLDRAVYERTIAIEEEYQIKFTAEKANDYTNDLLARASNYAKTGVDSLELVSGHTKYIPWSLAMSGCLYEWHDLEKINLDAIYWNQDAREEFSTPGGKLFFLTGDANYFSVGHSFSMFFNRELIEKVEGLESPYAVVKRNEWYLDTFKTYATTVDSNMDGDSSGILGQDCFGYVTPFTRGPASVMVSAGYPILTRDANRETGYKYTVNKDSVIKAVGEYVEFVLESGCAYYYKFGKGTDIQVARDAFIDNTVAFVDDHVHQASTFSKSEVDFGVLPWPMYNDECEGYTALVDSSFGVLCVPINSSDKNAERISYVLESLSYYGYRDIMPLYYETILSYQYLKNEEDVEMLRLIHDSLSFDIGFLYNPGGIGEAVIYVLDNKGAISLSTYIGQIEGEVDAALKKWADLDRQ